MGWQSAVCLPYPELPEQHTPLLVPVSTPGECFGTGGYENAAVQQGSMPYEPVLAPPASPYRSSPYEVVHPPMPGAYSQGIPGVSPVVTEPGGNSRVQLTIVGAQVGAVLGRNGTNISQIRQVWLDS